MKRGQSSSVAFPFFAGILLTRKPPETQEHGRCLKEGLLKSMELESTLRKVPSNPLRLKQAALVQPEWQTETDPWRAGEFQKGKMRHIPTTHFSSGRFGPKKPGRTCFFLGGGLLNFFPPLPPRQSIAASSRHCGRSQRTTGA